MNIRNFSIIAHVDHGKSTLADRFLEITGTVPKDKLQPQLLDSLALERERGITIKLAPVRLNYELRSINYVLNLIDTPGHVDFSYEVSRSLAAVEGAVLLVDAIAGIQAQTLAHGLAALEQNLTLIPVINKIDLPHAEIENVKKQLSDSFGFNDEEIMLVSGKTGQGVDKLLEEIVAKIPPPQTDPCPPSGGPQSSSGLRALRALVFDSFYDSFKGVIAQVRIMEGQTPAINAPIHFLQTKARGHILETGFFAPKLTLNNGLKSGDVGYIATGIKEPDKVQVGDTISTSFDVLPLLGYREVKPMVYVGLYPLNQDEFHDIKESLDRFRLSDPAFTYELEHSTALGAGFRCGFLGLLHAEVVLERLSTEFGAELLASAPSVEYMLGSQLVHNPSDLPQGEGLKDLKEPWVSLKIFVPQQFIGSVMELVQDKRGKFLNMQHYGVQVELSYEMPLAEMVTDFYDKLKSVSSGFASLDWQLLEFREVDAVRVDILVEGERVDALSVILVRQKAEIRGRQLTERLKGVLPRQNFEIAIQAAIGGKIIARQTLSAFRKDVTAKLYGGDRTRKDKLLEKQKKGKKKMKMVGKVEIPQEAFLSILKSD